MTNLPYVRLQQIGDDNGYPPGGCRPVRCRNSSPGLNPATVEGRGHVYLSYFSAAQGSSAEGLPYLFATVNSFYGFLASRYALYCLFTLRQQYIFIWFMSDENGGSPPTIAPVGS